MPDGRSWPRISIVTPSYNQSQFIEETIRSVLLQGYPDLEYIIMDGESTDESAGIIKKYERWLTFWASEKDRGQSHAINKGYARSSGTILQWINSDDLLLEGVLASIAEAFDGNSVVAGSVINFDETKETVVSNHGHSPFTFVNGGTCAYHQPGVWMASSKIRELGCLPENLHYTFDLIYTILYLERWPSVIYLKKPLVRFRLHPSSKTVAHRSQFNLERLRGLNLIQVAALSQSLRDSAKQRSEALRWSRYIRKIRRRTEGNAALFLLYVGLGAFKHPRVGFSRWSFKTIRRALRRKSAPK
ncbi:MAG: glycosyltransferase family 2 protein [Rhodomicrobium sp.]